MSPQSSKRPRAHDREHEEELTIDELARRAKTTSRNVRAYQARGLLPGPRVVGRTGYYGARHLHLLTAIGRLLEKGFSLASIGALLSFWEQGRTISDALGISESLAPGGRPSLSRKELERSFPELKARPELVERSERAGLLELDGDRVRFPNPLLVEVGVQLNRAGVPYEATLRTFEKLVEDMRPSASRYVDLLVDHVCARALGAEGKQSPEELVAAMRALVPIARVAVASTFARELREELQRTFLARLEKAGKLGPKAREAIAQALASGI